MQVVLDNIRSAHNVGSIFRTADAAGVSKLYLAGITPGPLDRFGRTNQKLTKVALGAEKNVPWEHAARTTALLDRLKKQGHVILALEQHGKAIPLFSRRSKTILQILSRKTGSTHKRRHAGSAEKFVLVVGPEVTGLSPAVLRRAKAVIEIPLHGKKESLNVSVAFGIAIFSLQQIIAQKCAPRPTITTTRR